MKQTHALISAAAIAAVTALPVFAQQTAQYSTTRMGEESALKIAQRVGACGGAGIQTARFDSDRLVRVTCSGAGLSGGLAAAAAGAGVVALIALAADGSSSGTTTTTTTTTTN